MGRYRNLFRPICLRRTGPCERSAWRGQFLDSVIGPPIIERGGQIHVVIRIRQLLASINERLGTRRHWIGRVLVAAAIALALGYLPRQFDGRAGLSRVGRLQRERDLLSAKNRHLAEENKRLERELRQLKSDRQAVERVARDELGLVKPGDLVFQFE